MNLIAAIRQAWRAFRGQPQRSIAAEQRWRREHPADVGAQLGEWTPLHAAHMIRARNAEDRTR